MILRRYVLWLLPILILALLGPAYAGEIEEIEEIEGIEEAEEIEYISLEEAKEIANHNSISLFLASLGIDEAQMNLEQAEAANIMQPSPTMLMQARAGFNLAHQSYLLEQDNLALTVKTDFYNVLRITNLIEIAKEGLESAKRHLDTAEKKFDAGTVTKLDVIQATRSLLNSQADLAQLEHNLELATMRFRQTLGLPLDAALLPENRAFSLEPIQVDLEKDLEFALENREEILQLKVAVDVAKKNIELADNEYTPALNLRQAELNYQTMKAQLEQVKELLTLEIKQNYLAILDAEKRIPVLQKGIEESEELLRLTELMYESDMVVANDLADTQIAVASAKNEMVNAIYDYNLAKARYLYTVARALQ